MKSLSFRQLQRKLDRIFSEYIRLRDSDEKGYCRCITCGTPHPWKEMDCGHYCGRRHLATRYHEMNCHAQCKHCNGFMEGQHFIYRRKLVEMYGEAAVQRIENIAMTPGGDNSISLEVKIEEYSRKLKALKKIKGIGVRA